MLAAFWFGVINNNNNNNDKNTCNNNNAVQIAYTTYVAVVKHFLFVTSILKVRKFTAVPAINETERSSRRLRVTFILTLLVCIDSDGM